MTSGPPAIRCRGLTKRFRGRTVVNGLDLDVEHGEVFGFLGPNGAGKTTTIRMLLGLVRPDAGEASLLGWRVPAPAMLATVGAMVEEPAFYPWLSGRGNLLVLLETGPPVPNGAVGEALERTGLAAVADRKVKGYSQGMRQRLGLAAALLRRPRLLILDEPANGLDPSGLRELRMLMRDLGQAGTTVFLSSHLLGEVERVCHRLAVLHRGQLVAVGAPDRLGGTEPSVRVTVGPEQQARALRLLERFTVQVEAPGVLLVAGGDGRAVNEALARGGVFAEALGAVRSGLEERFLALTAPRGDDAAAPS